MDGMHYFHTPHVPSNIDNPPNWRRPLRLTALSIVLVLASVIALDLIGVHIPIVDEFPSSTPL